MTCEKAKICNVCGARFKMERGCYLEKRCPACRLLGLGKTDIPKFEFPNCKSKRVNSSNSSSKFVIQEFEDELLKAYSVCCNKTWIEEDDPMMAMVMHDELLEQIDEQLLGEVNEREAKAIRMFIMEEYTLKEIGAQIDVTGERVRQIIYSGIKKLKHPKVGRPFLKYLDTDRRHIMW